MRNQYRPEQPERMTALMLLLLASFMCFPSVIAAVHRDHYYSLTADYDKYIPSLQYHLSRLPLCPLSLSTLMTILTTLIPGLRSQDKSSPTLSRSQPPST